MAVVKNEESKSLLTELFEDKYLEELGFDIKKSNSSNYCELAKEVNSILGEGFDHFHLPIF